MTARDRVAVIIEDDADIRRLLEEVLEQGGFETHSAGNGLDGVEKVRRYRPTLTTLDVSMPGIDGFEAAKRIRAFSDTYLIMLTARTEEIDTLMGLESGADDYIAKPFRPRELRARIDAMMRRPRLAVAGGEGDPSSVGSAEAVTPDASAGTAAPLKPGVPAEPSTTPAQPSPAAAVVVPATAAGDEGWIEHRGLRLEPDMRLVVVDGDEVELTRSEFDLLSLIISSRRRVRSKADLALALRGESYVTSYYVSDADKRAVEVHLANLRRKLGENASQPRWIETVRGVGYRLTADDGA
ncbi:response regulator transcription factor [Agromyces sp. Leaf222]|uniref:response regulator transcription factor n=1 Tax=Agromyces sp. Leaf222 TaxID=1735688 RepID=UPI0006F95EB1|nr:response regulator transcription factor [Agromyces sp. Leaf222]KQM82744.1 two-component system response regulator [Agromyces sp. Leaf222]